MEQMMHFPKNSESKRVDYVLIFNFWGFSCNDYIRTKFKIANYGSNYVVYVHPLNAMLWHFIQIEYCNGCGVNVYQMCWKLSGDERARRREWVSEKGEGCVYEWEIVRKLCECAKCECDFWLSNSTCVENLNESNELAIILSFFTRKRNVQFQIRVKNTWCW